MDYSKLRFPVCKNHGNGLCLDRICLNQSCRNDLLCCQNCEIQYHEGHKVVPITNFVIGLDQKLSQMPQNDFNVKYVLSIINESQDLMLNEFEKSKKEILQVFKDVESQIAKYHNKLKIELLMRFNPSEQFRNMFNNMYINDSIPLVTNFQDQCERLLGFQYIINQPSFTMRNFSTEQISDNIMNQKIKLSQQIKLLQQNLTSSMEEGIKKFKEAEFKAHELLDLKEIQISPEKKNRQKNYQPLSCQKNIVVHKDWISSVAISPDGSNMVTASFDKTIKLWNAHTMEIKHTFRGHQEEVHCVKFNSKGDKLVSGGSDNLVKVWCLNSLKQLYSFGNKNCQPRYVIEQRGVDFFPSGNKVCGGGTEKILNIWCLVTEQNLASLKGHEDFILSVSCSPNGQQIATGSQDTTIRLWSTLSYTCQSVLKHHTMSVLTVSFSPDSDWIASGSKDQSIKLWNSETFECEASIYDAHDAEVLCVKFSTHQKFIISGGRDNKVKIWNAELLNCTEQHQGHTDHVMAVDYNLITNQLISGGKDKSTQVWTN